MRFRQAIRSLFASGDNKLGAWPVLYCLWATLAICSAIAFSGFSAESITRLLVILFLFCQIAWRSVLMKALPKIAPKIRFIVLGTVLAAVVEGFHMISTPVFLSLRIYPDTSLVQGLTNYALDLLFTVPAYLIIFSVIWGFVNRYRYPLWHYVIIMGLGQALGDGGLLYFLNAPAMLLFIPYPMTNYHAINVIPFLAVRDDLKRGRPSSALIYLAIPGLIGMYLVCGAIIKLLGRFFGLEPN
jgi:hypothetical protein